MTKKEISEPVTIPVEVLKIVEDCFIRERNGDETARSSAAQDLERFLIKTYDGSFTLRSKENEGLSETMHTHHGALRESFEKFANPSRLTDKFETQDEVNILDICSGLGYNAAAAIDLWNSRQSFSKNNCRLRLDMVEISRETLAIALLIPSPLKAHEMIKKTVEDKLYDDGYLAFKFQDEEILENVDINILCRDARDLIKVLVRNQIKDENIYDAIFLDPFSPKLAPELYSVHFFKALKQIMTHDGLILTYTSAAPVRSGFVETGLHVGEGPRFGRKKGGTIASISPESIHQDLSKEDERMIALSDAGTSFKDPDLNDHAHSIYQRRKSEREALRGESKFASAVKTPTYLCEELEDNRLKRRVLRNLQKLGFDDLNSFKSRYVVCPQYNECICGRGCKKFNNSKERINEMSYRLEQVVRNRD